MVSISPACMDAVADLLCSTQASIRSVTFAASVSAISPNLLETIQNHSSITSLDLQNCIIQDPIAVRLAWLLRNNSTPALQFLDLSNCELTETGAISIASVLSTNSTLTTLKLAQNDFRDRGAQALAYALGENSALQHLDLASNRFTEACIEPFANALHQNSTLQLLNLCCNRLRDGVGQIFDALHHNSTLQDLDISYNRISDAGAVALASSLTNCGLCTLKMCDNDIGPEGGRSIAEAVQANTTLRVLALIRCGGECIGSPEILEGIQLGTLQENCQLECFTLCARDAGRREEILHTLNCNRGGRNILQNLNFPLTLWPMVLERADTIMYYRGEQNVESADSQRPQLSVLYSLLRGAPWLFPRPRSGTHQCDEH
jgi:Ran GTPase-activating protein (RanGAP) involved in mRNA processing and transport